MTQNNHSSTSSSQASSQAWARRINSIQQSKMTPVVRQQLMQRAENSRRAQENQLSARTAQMRNTSVYTSVSEGLRQVKAVTEAAEAEEQSRSSKKGARRENNSASLMLPSYSFITESTVSGMNRALRGTVDSSSRRARETMTMNMTSTMPITSVSLNDVVPEEIAETMTTLHVPLPAVAADKAEEFRTLLEQLRTEPTVDDEIKAKFAIFETYMDSVTVLRNDVYSTWENAKAQFETNAVHRMDQQLKKVDATENMGVADQDGVWIVYGMMVRASSNHTLLSTILKEMETKLALLASDVDCPMCLEPVGVGEGKKAAKILACCHRTCTECWTEWAAVHPHPFCPLCRQVDFVEELSRLASHDA